METNADRMWATFVGVVRDYSALDNLDMVALKMAFDASPMTIAELGAEDTATDIISDQLVQLGRDTGMSIPLGEKIGMRRALAEYRVRQARQASGPPSGDDAIPLTIFEFNIASNTYKRGVRGLAMFPGSSQTLTALNIVNSKMCGDVLCSEIHPTGTLLLPSLQTEADDGGEGKGGDAMVAGPNIGRRDPALVYYLQSSTLTVSTYGNTDVAVKTTFCLVFDTVEGRDSFLSLWGQALIWNTNLVR